MDATQHDGLPISPFGVVHADWSVAAGKRWMARAFFDGQRYHLHAAENVDACAPSLERMLPWLVEETRARTGHANTFLGFDFPIGVPEAWANQVGINDFVSFLRAPKGGGLLAMTWREFYDVASHPDEIRLHRPFYPKRSGKSKQAHLVEALGLGDISDLKRQCDEPIEGGPTPCPLFWTLGANQVGKAAIVGWRDVLEPALHTATLDLAIWPFDATLAKALTYDCTVAEVYPALFYGELGINTSPQGKKSQSARQINAANLLNWCDKLDVYLSDHARHDIEEGFPDGINPQDFGPMAHALGEDRFDATIGLLGMLGVVLGHIPLFEPSEPAHRHVEGWLLGRQAS